jgi:hypothetical protein
MRDVLGELVARRDADFVIGPAGKAIGGGEARIHSIPRRAASACVALDGLGQVSALGFGQRYFFGRARKWIATSLVKPGDDGEVQGNASEQRLPRLRLRSGSRMRNFRRGEFVPQRDQHREMVGHRSKGPRRRARLRSRKHFLQP